MHTNDELTGTLVLVYTTPKQLAAEAPKGKIGMITAEDLEMDVIYVGFGMADQMCYTTDALMVLKRPVVIYADTIRNATQLETSDFKTLFKISMLLDSGLTKDKRAAIGLACTNDVIREYSMMRLSDTQHVRQVRKLKRGKANLQAAFA